MNTSLDVENALAVIALAELAGVPFAALRAGLEAFAPSPHRLELVGSANGVRYINDSKATNPDSVVRALETVSPPPPGRVLLIAGGLDKEMDFSPLTPVLPRHVREIFLIGKSREKLANLWRDIVYCHQFSSLEAAVDAAVEHAAPGDVILLSPGCASMDMFANYAERGDAFRRAVKRRIGE
jgi:UDP-N-acetylmuramoylalanine--D-glutamate ligase